MAVYPVPTGRGVSAGRARIVTVAVSHERSASLDSTAAVTVANREFFSVFERSAALAATGAITTVHQRELLRQAALAATGAITASGEIEGGFDTFERSASLDAIGAINAAGDIAGALARSASLNATAAIQAAYQREHLRQTAIAGTGAIQVAYQRYLLRQAALSATGEITAAGFVGILLEYPLGYTYIEPVRHVAYREPQILVYEEHAAIKVRA